VIAAFVGNEQGSFAGGSKKVLALVFAVAAAIALIVTFLAPAPKASAATVTNPGPFTAEFAGGYLKIGNTLPPFAISELGGDEPVTMDGTIDGSGEIFVPSSNLNFEELEMVLEDIPLIGNVTLGIQIFTPQDITGSLDPVTGETSMDIKLSVKIRRIAGSSLADLGNNCYVGNPSQPVGGAGPIWVKPSTEVTPDPNAEPGTSLGGVPYNPATGEFRVADRTFYVPGNNGCSGVAAGMVDDQVGIPSASGNNTAELQIKMDPAPISTATITIGTKPAAATNQTNANFEFSSNVPAGLTYECQLDSGEWTNCDSMAASYSGLADGSHTFSVRARVGDTPAGETSYTWTIDTVVPVYTVTGAPSGLTSSRSANISFTVNKTMPPNSTQCVLDGVTTNNCTSPRNLTGLADGPHTFEVKGTDAVGNEGSTIRSWTVDGTKPTVEITSAPATEVTTSDVQFAFVAQDNMTANPTTQCQIRNMKLNEPAGQVVQAWTNCSSPHSQVRPTGKWRFEIRAIDAANNVSDIVTYDWTANTAEPIIDSLVGPSGPMNANTGGTRDSDAAFEFNAETYDIDEQVIPGTTFRYECWLDGEFLGDCAPPMTLADLTGGEPIAEGEHTFEVKPYLVAEPEVAGFRTPYTWHVDTVDPTGEFAATPNVHHNSATAEFSLNVDGTGSAPTAQCKLDGGNWSPCDSNTTHTVVVGDGSHTLDLRTVDQAGNASQPVSHTWVTDTQLPTGTIHERPLLNDKSDTAKFVYNTNDNQAGVQAYCQLDDGEEIACARTTHTYSSIADGPHTFTLRVADTAGNEVVRSYEWRSDTTAPELAITETQPAPLSNQTSAAFKLLGTDTDGSGIADVSCRIDEAAWEACENGNVWNFYTGPFASGTHKFETKVTDVAGNSTSRSHQWTVDLEKPDVAIATDIGQTKSTSASIKFLSTDSGATFECKLDAGAWGACTSPKAYNDLALGNHVFMVRAVDQAGNKGDEDSLAWTVYKDPTCEESGQVGAWPDCQPQPCPTGQVGTAPNCYDPCPEGWTGTPPNCEKPQPQKCDDGFIGDPPNCKKQQPAIKKPNNTTATFDGKKLAIRLKCPAGFKPRCQGNAVVVTGKGKKAKVMSSSVKNTSLAGKWKLVTLVIKPAYRDQVLALTAEGSKRITVKQTLRSKKKKKRIVYHTYKVRTKG